MTTESGGRRRGPRRAVRAPGPVGGDSRALLSRLPALPRGQASTADAQDAAPSPSTEPEPPVAFRSKDDSDVGWGSRSDDSNDDRLERDKPPHW
ncbi:hypothetical protein [Cellulomonas alba]|uniref:Uncharacterized protein n=1 Tax=Cellulomonas alba TaxID=3053467 RepID=A0ABT7SHA8_9CELL|nr:hypothetical protein [Cellulomonas alba]MDM7855526.1 hypothetical protein [Cellulomonas alba]